MRVGVLGPVEVWADGSLVEIGGVRVRMLAARLGVAEGGAVPVETLIDGLWGEEPPAEAAGALQALVSRLRKALRGTGTVELVAGGYRLAGVQTDARRFEEMVAEGRKELAAGRVEAASRVLGQALGLWRGPALSDVLDAPFAQVSATRLEDLRVAAQVDRFEAELRLGRHVGILSELETAGAEQPLSERVAALRIRALAAAGRQADALAVYEDMRARLDEELGIDPSAELRDTHLALLRGEIDIPPVRIESATKKLPARLTRFVGRDDELAGVGEQLENARLVTIVGPGGAGKTRLAVEAMDRYDEGAVFFVPLAEVGTPDQLADAIAGALDTDGPDRTNRLTELLNVGPAVLVLDNCEHVVEAAAALAQQLLDSLPELRILATSREPLAITGEALCHLGPLGLPPADADPVRAAGFESVRLFLDRAAAVRPGFALDDGTVGPTVEVCRQLDGIPLALELAAAKLRSLTVDQIADRLGDRFRLLTSGSRTALPRQCTLLALVEWSWDLLETQERLLAQRLSLFPGGATVEALEGICADAALPACDIVYVLDALVEKSIVVSADGRYRMLESIRAYAADRLAESGDDLTDRFVRYHLDLAEAHEPALRTGEQLDAIALFDAEHANIAAALRNTVNAGDVLAARFVRSLFWYWGIRGMSTQFETALADVLRLGEALPADARAAFRVIHLMGGNPAGDPPSAQAMLAECDRTGALEFHPALPLWTALLAGHSGDADLEQRQQRTALDWPDPWVRASAHLARDMALTGRGELPAGAEARRAARHGFETVGDRWGLGMALIAVGRALSLHGDHDQALATFARAVALASELGTEDDILAARTELATERMRGGDLAGAERDIHAAQRLAADGGLSRLAIAMLFCRNELHRRRGELRPAADTLAELEHRLRRQIHPDPTAANRINVARLRIDLAATGQDATPPADARIDGQVRSRGYELLVAAVRDAFRNGDPVAVTLALAKAVELWAELLLLDGDPESAAIAMGVTAVIRGVVDAGEPELRALVAAIGDRLGEDGYRSAYARGAGFSRSEALAFLAAVAGSA
ncbi:AAA family ATPase [Nocardia sp. 2]|uniref:AAA family ATPase n=1 Tax=Nocardia acididurans TaxID=2802282 RepID=A0ABS1M3Z6_9NOCA|nr:BTAD domain-containing putative transcriptional regulator [Nocardia acididurans]MBL1074514.1 AAA family ATPase [Nocardia acididurans]